MKINRIIYMIAMVIISMAWTGCNDGKSYAELLNDENISVNSYLANQRVIGYEKRDSTFNFITGEDAPYYEMDNEGNIYMQVINAGTPGNRATTDQLIYFRFTRYNLNYYKNGVLPTGEGNDSDLTYGSTSFRFDNMSATSSYQWGSGIQTPLYYLPIDCVVNLVIKSQYGVYSEMSYVYPYLYNIRFFKSQI